MGRLSLVSAMLVAIFFSFSVSAQTLKVLTWEGYVLPHEVAEVNGILKDAGYDVQVEVIDPWAQGPRQMYLLLKDEKADVSFLTLNYIQQKNGQIADLLQPININSSRLTNYASVLPQFKNIKMGTKDGAPLYVPWGGGAYGIWADMDRLSQDEVPQSVGELWLPKWKGKLSLTKGQIEPNIALASLALNKNAFYLNDEKLASKTLYAMTSSNSPIQQKLNGLYEQVGGFWESSPNFDNSSLLVASYGFGAAEANRKGGNWQLVSFKEGNTVWLDTINFHKNLSGKKLEAAEIFTNYFIGKKVQDRIARELGMVSVSEDVSSNPLLEQNPDFFRQEMFWPAYNKKVSMVMRKLSRNAMRLKKNKGKERHLESIL